MKLLFREHNWDVSNDSTELLKAMQELEQLFSALDEHYSHMIVDDLEIYEPFEQFLLKNVHQVENVRVVTQSLEQLVDGVLVSIGEFLDRALPELELLSNRLYQGAEIANKLEQLVDAILWIIQALNTLKTHEGNDRFVSQFGHYSTDISSRLPMLLEAMESRDQTMIADIITYELTPVLQNMQNTVKESITSEVIEYDHNR